MTGGPDGGSAAAASAAAGAARRGRRGLARRRGEGAGLATLEFDGQARGAAPLAIGAVSTLATQAGSRKIDHDARFAGTEQAEAKRLDDRVGARRRRAADRRIDLEVRLRDRSTTMRSGSAIAWALASTGPERSKLSLAVSPSSESRAATATGGGAASSAARAAPDSSVGAITAKAKRRLATTLARA